MSRNATWTNQDGLVVGFNKHTVDSNVSALVSAESGNRRIIQQVITGTDLVDTFAIANSAPQDVIIPRGSVIIRATFQTVTAFTGSSSTLDIGLWTKGLATDVVDDADGLVADMTIAELTSIGEVHILDGALVATAGQTAVGAIGLGNCVIAPSWETAAFTAGTGILTVEYQVPAQINNGNTIAAV